MQEKVKYSKYQIPFTDAIEKYIILWKDSKSLRNTANYEVKMDFQSKYGYIDASFKPWLLGTFCTIHKTTLSTLHSLTCIKKGKCSKFYYQTPFIDVQTSDGVSEILEL